MGKPSEIKVTVPMKKGSKAVVDIQRQGANNNLNFAPQGGRPGKDAVVYILDDLDPGDEIIYQIYVRKKDTKVKTP